MAKNTPTIAQCRSAVPYDALPSLADAPRTPTLPAAQNVRHALGYLQGALAQLSDPSLLFSAIFTMEAADSSRIENIVTTGERLFRLSAAPGLAADQSTREASACRTAMQSAIVSLPHVPLSWRTAKDIASCITSESQDLRRSKVALGSPDGSSVVYTPPTDPAVLQARISEWERLMHAKTDDPLARLARLHYQFVAIHPFTDGNGRTARVLHLLLMQHFGLLDHPVLYLSRSIRRSKAEYYARLAAVTFDGDWSGLEAYFLDVTQDAVAWTLARVRSVLALRAATAAHLRAAGRRFSRPGLLEALFAQPFVRIGTVAEMTGLTRPTAAILLDALSLQGMLQVERNGREKLYFFTALMQALQGPAESTGG